MKNALFPFTLLLLIAMSSCRSGSHDNVLLTRTFTASGWERFDFITRDVEVKQPVTYNLNMEVTFDPSYPFDEFMVVFSVFDANETPLRAKSYRFRLKDAEGQWKSELKDGSYTFLLPINKELTLNEPGSYKFQLENRMPITPLAGIKKITILNQK